MAFTATKKEFAVKGMTCMNCVNHVTRAIQGVEGVKTVKVDLKGGKAAVEYDAEKASPLKIAGAVKKAGYAMEF